MFRMSLRELFVLVAAVALAIVTLIFASTLWQASICMVAVFSAMAAVIIGLVDRGPRRAFATGFAVAMLGYLLVIMNAPKFAPANRLGSGNQNAELDVYEGRLPTSLVLHYFYLGIQRTKYFDAITGQAIPEAESGNLHLIGEGVGGFGGGMFGGGGGFAGAGGINVPAGKRAAMYETRPSRENFMVTGHFWWALLFGYVGGHFGRIVYLRRERETYNLQES